MGGVTQQCTELTCCLYKQIIDTIIPVSSPKVAEVVKLLENTFRSINIALVNEIAIVEDIVSLLIRSIFPGLLKKMGLSYA
ncbi:MAG: hypothetical protein NG784_14195 [Candidatus Jettenia sp.]|nr:hypothetical protein [Candidatus Jettenia sp.]